MRVVELGRIASQAEMLRWRSLARRQAGRLVLGVIGGLFAMAALTCAHAAGVIALIPQVGLLYSVAIVGGVDVSVAAICMALAARDRPGRIEREALTVREEARGQMVKAAAFSGLVAPLLRRGLGLLIQQMFRRRRAT